MYIQKNQSLRLILASRSESRRRILADAGLAFEQAPADLDETAMLAELENSGLSIPSRALVLSASKAQAVAARIKDPDAVYIGSDQILELDGAALEGPRSKEEAAERLRMLKGRSHDLVAGVALVKGGRMAGQTYRRVTVRMRDFSTEELETYLEQASAAALSTVGAYELEGLGALLIDEIEGDWHAALGMPLWPLLRLLRKLSPE